MPLTQEQRDQLNGIIGKMKDNNEPEENIQEMVGQFKAKYETGRTMREAVPPEGTITQAPPRWVPWAQSGIEMAGYGVGGAAGTALAGPWGGRVGSGIGYAVARQGAEPLIRAFKTFVLQPPPGSKSTVLEQPVLENPLMHPGRSLTLGERAVEFGKDVGLGTLMKGAEEKVITPLMRKALLFYAAGRTPGAQEVAAIAEREGVKIPASDITQSTGQAAFSSAVQKLPQSAHTMQKEAIDVTGQFANYTERTLGKLGGKVESGTAGELAKEAIPKKVASEIESQFAATGGKIPRKLTGQSIQEGIATARKEAETVGGQFYNQAMTAVGDTPMIWEKVPKVVEHVKNSDRYKLLSESGKKEVDNFISLITEKTLPETGEVSVMGITVPKQISKQGGKGFIDQGALEAVEKEANRITNFLDAEGLRKTLAQKVYSRSGRRMESYGPMREILEAYEGDMASSAKQAGTKAFKAFKIARENWATSVIGRFGEPGATNILTKLEKASPDTIIDTIRSAKTNELSQLVGVLPKKTLARLQNGLLTDIMETGATKTASGEFIYNGPQIAKTLEQIGDDRIRSIFSPYQVRYLRDLAIGKAGEGQIFKIATGTPEYALNRLKNASLQEVDLIKRNLNPDEFLQYRQGFLTQIFQKNSQTSGITGEIIYNGPQIAKDLFGKNGLGEQRLRLLLSPEELDFLKDFVKVGERMGSSWRIAGNPSGTAHTLYVLHMLGQIGSGVGATIAGEEAGRKSGPGAGFATAGAFLSPYLVAKFMTSNLGRRYLMGGLPMLEKAVSKTFPYGVIATRGILGSEKEEEKKEERPVIRGGGLPFESRQFGGPVSPTVSSVNDEISLASEAIEKGVDIEQVRKAFRERTGQEL